MTEIAEVERIEGVEIKDPVERRLSAMRALADFLLFVDGTSSDHSRDLEWSVGEGTVAIRRHDHTTELGQRYGQATLWLHLNGGADAADAYPLGSDLPSEERPEPEVLEMLSALICDYATLRLYDFAKARLEAVGTREGELINRSDLWHKGLPVSLYDFTDAPHEPYILIRVDPTANATPLVAGSGARHTHATFDLTSDELRQSDKAYPHGWPMSGIRKLSRADQGYKKATQTAELLHEELLLWFHRALLEDEQSTGSGMQMRIARGLVGRERPEMELTEDALADILVEANHIEAYRHPNVLLQEVNRARVLQTVAHIALKGHIIDSDFIVGIIYEPGKELSVELVEPSNRQLKNTVTLHLDLVDETARGLIITAAVRRNEGDSVADLYPSSVAKAIIDVFECLSKAVDEGSVRPVSTLQTHELPDYRFYQARRAAKLEADHND